MARMGSPRARRARLRGVAEFVVRPAAAVSRTRIPLSWRRTLLSVPHPRRRGSSQAVHFASDGMGRQRPAVDGDFSAWKTYRPRAFGLTMRARSPEGTSQTIS